MLIFAVLLWASPASASTLFLGDSLAVGTAPYIHIKTMRVDARVGRPLAEGVAHLRALPHQDRLMVSLFTNDNPGHVAELRHAVAYSLTRAHCVVWSTIHVGYEDFRQANHYLRRHAQGRFQLVDWDRYVDRHPELLYPDSIHPTPAGYYARSRLYVRALHRCPR